MADFRFQTVNSKKLHINNHIKERNRTVNPKKLNINYIKKEVSHLISKI